MAHLPKTTYARMLPDNKLFDDQITAEWLSNNEPYADGNEIDSEATLQLAGCDAQNLNGDGFVNTITAFTIAHAQGIYPPRWALDHINEAFMAYLYHRGKYTLDEIMELGAEGEGKDKPVTTIVKNRMLHHMFMQMWQLNTLFGVKVRVAAHMNAQLLKVMPWKYSAERPSYDVDTLNNQYYGWKKTQNLNPDAFRSSVASLSEAALFDSILSAYPKDCLPENLQQRFKDFI